MHQAPLILVSKNQRQFWASEFLTGMTSSILRGIPLRGRSIFEIFCWMLETVYENIHVDITEFNIPARDRALSVKQGEMEPPSGVYEIKALYSCRMGYNCDSLCQQTMGQNLWRPNVFTSVKVRLFVWEKSKGETGHGYWNWLSLSTEAIFCSLVLSP